jgi:murein DD-endopeptidase MepM/ murein hydrolase activator NlpD
MTERVFCGGRLSQVVTIATAIVFASLQAFVVLPNAAAQATATPQPEVVKARSLSIDTEVRPAIGQFVTGDDDKQYLAYELFIVNWNQQDLRIASIDIEDAVTGQRLMRYDSKVLEDPNRMGTIPFAVKLAPVRVLPPGRTAVVSMDVKLPLGAGLPSSIRLRIHFESDPYLKLLLDDGTLSSDLFAVTEPMPIDRHPPLVLGPPLRGGPWLCGNGFIGTGTDGKYWFTSHDAQYATYNVARIHVPSRYGCDFAKIDATISARKVTTPDSISLSAFYGYGADVLAVADGLVIKTKDGIPENEPRIDKQTIMPIPLTDATANGNMVVLKIGEGQYACYAHLQPGSLRVKEGDRVRKGQVIGKIGNSGSTNGPHLHFNVQRGPAMGGDDFLPYVFTSYWLEGLIGKMDTANRRQIKLRVPTNGSIITFPLS